MAQLETFIQSFLHAGAVERILMRKREEGPYMAKTFRR